MTIDLGDTTFLTALLALVVGLAILVYPRILNYLVAAYLIIVGVLGLIPFFTGSG